MKKDELYDALSSISKDMISESDDFRSVSADFRKEKAMKKRIAVSACCLAFVCAGVIGAGKSGVLKNTFTNTKEDTTAVSVSSETMVTSSAPSAEQSVTAAAPAADETLYYSKLVRNAEAPELNGYDNAAALLSISGFDIDAFKESIVDEPVNMVEGEILDIWVNQYEYETASDKFEPNGRLCHKDSTVAYKIRVDKVYSGDFKVGDEVTVEDYYFICDSVVSIKKGGHYVIPIGKGDGKLWMNDEIVSGEGEMASKYFTVYQFHPQIEKVSGGYIVPGDWKTLITDECTEIKMDVEWTYLPGSLYFVPDDVFNDRMDLIFQS